MCPFAWSTSPIIRDTVLAMQWGKTSHAIKVDCYILPINFIGCHLIASLINPPDGGVPVNPEALNLALLLKKSTFAFVRRNSSAYRSAKHGKQAENPSVFSADLENILLRFSRISTPMRRMV